ALAEIRRRNLSVIGEVLESGFSEIENARAVAHAPEETVAEIEVGLVVVPLLPGGERERRCGPADAEYVRFVRPELLLVEQAGEPRVREAEQRALRRAEVLRRSQQLGAQSL